MVPQADEFLSDDEMDDREEFIVLRYAVEKLIDLIGACDYMRDLEVATQADIKTITDEVAEERGIVLV